MMPDAPTARRFGFFMFPKFEELDLIGPWEMATMWRDNAGGPECLTVAEQAGPITCAKGLTTMAEHDFASCPPLDFLLVPGGTAARRESRNSQVLEWLHQQAASCQHVLSVCTGSWILGAAGLLDGRRATSHWQGTRRLARHPGVTVVEDQRWVRDGNIWTSAGVSAGIDLTLGFIEAIDGPDAAATVQLDAEYFPDGKLYGGNAETHAASRS